MHNRQEDGICIRHDTGVHIRRMGHRDRGYASDRTQGYIDVGWDTGRHVYDAHFSWIKPFSLLCLFHSSTMLRICIIIGSWQSSSLPLPDSCSKLGGVYRPEKKSAPPEIKQAIGREPGSRHAPIFPLPS